MMRQRMKNRPYQRTGWWSDLLSKRDIVYAANLLSRFCSDPGEEHWLLAKRVLRYLKGTKTYDIKYEKNK